MYRKNYTIVTLLEHVGLTATLISLSLILSAPGPGKKIFSAIWKKPNCPLVAKDWVLGFDDIIMAT